MVPEQLALDLNGDEFTGRVLSDNTLIFMPQANDPNRCSDERMLYLFIFPTVLSRRSHLQR